MPSNSRGRHKLGGSVIRSGGLVAFPTETVYGLGANGLDGEAVNKIFEAKGRPNDNPLILHIAKKSDLKDLWKSVPERARLLMDEFWPGPLTMVYLKSSRVPEEVTGGLDTVAVRMPDNRTALALIRAAGVPIAAPSANLSGKPSPTTADHVKADMNGKIDVIIDGGPCNIGVESTVVSLMGGAVTILRPGGITREMLEAVIGPVNLSPAVLAPMKQGEAAASPGMKYKHYAPDAQVIVGTGSLPDMAAKLNSRVRQAGGGGPDLHNFRHRGNSLFLQGEKVCYNRREKKSPYPLREPFCTVPRPGRQSGRNTLRGTAGDGHGPCVHEQVIEERGI